LVPAPNAGQFSDFLHWQQLAAKLTVAALSRQLIDKLQGDGHWPRPGRRDPRAWATMSGQSGGAGTPVTSGGRSHPTQIGLSAESMA